MVALDGTSVPVSFCTRFCEGRFLYTYHPKASLSRPNPSSLLLLMELEICAAGSSSDLELELLFVGIAG